MVMMYSTNHSISNLSLLWVDGQSLMESTTNSRYLELISSQLSLPNILQISFLSYSLKIIPSSPWSLIALSLMPKCFTVGRSDHLWYMTGKKWRPFNKFSSLFLKAQTKYSFSSCYVLLSWWKDKPSFCSGEYFHIQLIYTTLPKIFFFPLSHPSDPSYQLYPPLLSGNMLRL